MSDPTHPDKDGTAPVVGHPAVVEAKIDLSRPLIDIRVGQNPESLRKIRELLAAHAEKLGLMVFGQSIVHPFIVERRGFKDEPVESLELNHVSVRALAVYADTVTQFARWTKPRREGASPQLAICDCPIPLAQLYLDTREGWGKMPYVTRICETPLLRDGKLFAKRGYDAHSSVWLHAPPHIELRSPLTKETAVECLARVRKWLAEFPFEDHTESSDNEVMSINESVAICAMLTAAMRASLPAAPGFLFDKTDYGAGATTLAKLVHIILTGRLPPVMTVSSTNEEELRKQLDAAQLAGRSCIVLDNVRKGAQLISTALAQLISEPTRLVRVLGMSKDVEVACSQMVLVTGVNATVADDLVRRFLRSRLVTTQERPQERLFQRPNLLEEAQLQRAEILSDLYTIAAAYVASGERVAVTGLAGFGDWLRLCAEPLVWLHHRDPVPSSKSLEAEDEKVTTLREVISNWAIAYGNTPITTRTLIDCTFPDLYVSQPMREAADRLAEIFAEKCKGKDGKVDRQKVGTWLNGIRGKVIGKQSLERGEDAKHEKVSTWVLRNLL